MPNHATTPPPTVNNHVDNLHESITHLPKLDLPQFAGNPLNWQPFWDCFQAAMDSNRSLTGVQKLSYLRAQLQGDRFNIIKPIVVHLRIDCGYNTCINSA